MISQARATGRDVEVVTFGCRLNACESEAISAQARAEGIRDMVVFNTCAVTGEAVRQARQAIRKARRAQPAARLVEPAARRRPIHISLPPWKRWTWCWATG